MTTPTEITPTPAAPPPAPAKTDKAKKTTAKPTAKSIAIPAAALNETALKRILACAGATKKTDNRYLGTRLTSLDGALLLEYHGRRNLLPRLH